MGSDLELILYPNPTYGDVFIKNIENTESLVVNIFSTKGERLAILEGQKLEVEQKISQVFRGLSAGAYVVRLQTFNKTYHKKIIKE